MKKVAQVWPLVTFIQEELRARHWSWDDLARRMCRQAYCRQGTLERIRAGKHLTRYGAAGLAGAFGTSVELWLRLDAQYWASLKREVEEEVEA